MRKLLITGGHNTLDLAERLGITELSIRVPSRYRQIVTDYPTIIVEQGDTVLKVISIPHDQFSTFTYDFSTISVPDTPPARSKLRELILEVSRIENEKTLQINSLQSQLSTLETRLAKLEIKEPDNGLN